MQRIFTAILLVASLIASSGCIVVGLYDEYDSLDNELAEGQFAPDVFVNNDRRNFVIPFFLIQVDRNSSDLVLELFDSTYKRRSKGFSEVVLDEILIEYANGESKSIVSEDSLLAERTFSVAQEDEFFSPKCTKTFSGVLDKKTSFVVTIKGVGILDSGERIPFKRTCSYEYNGRDLKCFFLTA